MKRPSARTRILLKSPDLRRDVFGDDRAGEGALRRTLTQRREKPSGDLSSVLEELRLRGEPERPRLGPSSEISNRAIAVAHRYAEDLPIASRSVIGGSSCAPGLMWDAPLVEVAPERLRMTGRREFPPVARAGVDKRRLGALPARSSEQSLYLPHGGPDGDDSETAGD